MNPGIDEDRLLGAMPATRQALAESTGYAPGTVHRHLVRLRAERRIYVADYADDARGRKFLPVYAVGKRKDAPRPGARETSTERMRRLRAARREDL